jgi:hypothetical protein
VDVGYGPAPQGTRGYTGLIRASPLSEGPQS